MYEGPTHLETQKERGNLKKEQKRHRSDQGGVRGWDRFSTDSGPSPHPPVTPTPVPVWGLSTWTCNPLDPNRGRECNWPIHSNPFKKKPTRKEKRHFVLIWSGNFRRKTQPSGPYVSPTRLRVPPPSDPVFLHRVYVCRSGPLLHRSGKVET